LVPELEQMPLADCRWPAWQRSSSKTAPRLPGSPWQSQGLDTACCKPTDGLTRAANDHADLDLVLKVEDHASCTTMDTQQLVLRDGKIIELRAIPV
jgi:hypothetical protein